MSQLMHRAVTTVVVTPRFQRSLERHQIPPHHLKIRAHLSPTCFVHGLLDALRPLLWKPFKAPFRVGCHLRTSKLRQRPCLRWRCCVTLRGCVRGMASFIGLHRMCLLVWVGAGIVSLLLLRARASGCVGVWVDVVTRRFRSKESC